MNLPAGLVRLTRPLTLAVVSGRADPPFPRSRRLAIPVPASLGLLPFRTVDLVVLANLLIFWLAYGGGLSSLLSGNDGLSIPYPEWEIYYAAAVSSLPLLLREHWPLAAWRISAVGMLSTAPLMDTLGGHPVSIAGIVTYLLVVYSVAVRCERETTLGGWIASMLCMALSTTSRDDLVIAAILLSVTALFGYNVRARRLAARRLAEEEQRSERALTAQATLEERARIARELHDVVAHHMSVIAIQAEAVPLQATGDAGRLEEGLREIRGLSLAAMTEMRRVVGVLRDGDGHADTAPQPGLGRLEELVGTARSAGLTVTLKLGGDLMGLPTAVSLSAYRIAQESLSNAMRHAPGSAVSMRISRSGAELHIHVENDARRRSPAPPEHAGEPGHTGHGLIGMRERVSMLGGRLWTGPVGTGFAVTAILPIMENA
ncbi:sensor histidine kinase [Streptosporangium sp. NBC_01756]|uniref:sensor histidine kinase n=1 Tax=Streptosporangium sp. NBC_01756 TaxID=2975950 RepID=UPI002DD9155D|nr:histidine kinase [Streptosporangium sp. NBC_01756]WSC85530.1 histidine kinase [Streptosporangium sp. NBC_01756]